MNSPQEVRKKQLVVYNDIRVRAENYQKPPKSGRHVCLPLLDCISVRAYCNTPLQPNGPKTSQLSPVIPPDVTRKHVIVKAENFLPLQIGRTSVNSYQEHSKNL